MDAVDHVVKLSPPLTPAEMQEVPLPTDVPSTSVVIIDAQPTSVFDSGDVEKESLEDDILQLLGDAPEPETITGKGSVVVAEGT